MCDLFPEQLIKEFRDDEMEHHDTGLEHDAETVSPFSFFITNIPIFQNFLTKVKAESVCCRYLDSGS